MINVILALIIFLGIFSLLSLGVFAGRRFGKWRLSHDPTKKLGVVTVAEGAVFALLGLLIAFTFTGAYERFESRKIRIIDEVNAIDTVYLRIKLLAPTTQQNIRLTLYQYLNARVALYRKLSDLGMDTNELAYSKKLQEKIWQESIEAIKITNNVAVTMLFIPAINDMFEIANTRLAFNKVHPPFAIFLLLITLAALSSFLAGYSTAARTIKYSIHIASYILITSITLYLIIDLEFPRQGLIRMDFFDFLLQDEKYTIGVDLKNDPPVPDLKRSSG